MQHIEDTLFQRLLRPLVVGTMVLVMGCTTPVDREKARIDGVVERIAVSGPEVGRNTGPFCGPYHKGKIIPGEVPPRPKTSYKVGPGDSLKFNIFGEAGMNDIDAKVDDGGFVQLPIIKLVNVQGKTTRDIQEELIAAYEGEFQNPWVTVELTEPKSAPIYFLGEFRDPGVRYVSGATNVLEAIALAGGFEEDAYLPGARVLRNNHVCSVDLYALLRNGAFEQNLWMKGGDVVFAPRKEDMSVYVLGAVVDPRAVPYGADGRTLLQVLSMAGDVIPGSAYLKEVRIVRTFGPTHGELILVDVDAMLAGRGLDFPLEPGDVVYVPRSALGDWNNALGEILPSLQVISGVLTPITLIRSLRDTQ